MKMRSYNLRCDYGRVFLESIRLSAFCVGCFASRTEAVRRIGLDNESLHELCVCVQRLGTGQGKDVDRRWA